MVETPHDGAHLTDDRDTRVFKQVETQFERLAQRKAVIADAPRPSDSPPPRGRTSSHEAPDATTGEAAAGDGHVAGGHAADAGGSELAILQLEPAEGSQMVPQSFAAPLFVMRESEAAVLDDMRAMAD